MKKLFTLLVIVLFPISVFAQVPQTMSYQAVIRNSLSELVTSHTVGMKISILQGSSTGTVVYTETQTPTTNANGLVSIEIGGEAGFDAINWAGDTYFIKTETDPSGGTTYSITGTSQLLSVPYSLYAKNAGGHYVGELYAGGIVVAVWKESGVEHGLIASLSDVSTSAAWSNISATLIGATAQSPFDGQANTNAILGQNGHTASAAKLCDDYNSGGFSDWYLPAIWELYKCHNAAYIVTVILGAENGFKFSLYWSSTEANESSTWTQSFGGTYGDDKNVKSNTYRVRAVRRF
jgi:hypothetical protein